MFFHAGGMSGCTLLRSWLTRRTAFGSWTTEIKGQERCKGDQIDTPKILPGACSMNDPTRN